MTQSTTQSAVPFRSELLRGHFSFLDISDKALSLLLSTSISLAIRVSSRVVILRTGLACMEVVQVEPWQKLWTAVVQHSLRRINELSTKLRGLN